jgi:hypothetical protein
MSVAVQMHSSAMQCLQSVTWKGDGTVVCGLCMCFQVRTGVVDCVQAGHYQQHQVVLITL